MGMTSKIEILTRKYLAFYFPKYEPLYNYRPDFLRNEKTGKNLELDIYYPNLRLAIEVNGPQHLLRDNVNREVFKILQCADLGILLHSVYGGQDVLKLRKTMIDFYSELRKPGYCGHEDFQDLNYKYILGRLSSKISKEILSEILSYKPSVSFQSEFFDKVERQLAREKQGIFKKELSAEEAQKQEIASVRRRMEAKSHLVPT